MKKKSASVPKAVKPAYSAIVSLTDDVCKNHLNEEYAELARLLAAALSRKRPSPILKGKPEIWACGIIHALGTINFLFDKSQTPHIRADKLAELFGVGKSSGANKAKFIRDTLNMHQFDPTWYLPSRIDSSPMVWILQVNGLMVDVRIMPREVQVIAYEKGLIPYIPADQ